MNARQWAQPVSAGEAARRAGGRRGYNRWRQFRAAHRRMLVARLMYQGLTQAEIGRRLGVSQSTISRDMAANEALAAARHICPTCGQRRPQNLSKLDITNDFLE